MRNDVQDYWNNVERAVHSRNGRLRDNFEKRRLMLAELAKYNFTDARILELGTGAGLTAHLVNMLSGRVAYTGIDISSTYAEAAKKLFNLHVVVSDLADPIPAPDGVVDCVFAFDCLEHIDPAHRANLFAELNRVLDKEKRFIFINNPLSESHHDQAFDFHFEEADIFALAKVTNTRLIEVKVLQATSALYQFIVLGKI